MIIQHHEFELAANYFQFYFMDDAVRPPISDDVTDEDMKRRIKVAPNIVVVYAERSTTVPVVVEIHNTEPPRNLDEWDHVSECSIDVSSGRLVILGCTDYLPDAARVSIPPGHYRVRVHHGGLGTISDDRLEGSDHYKVVLWQGNPRELSVVKQTSYEVQG